MQTSNTAEMVTISRAEYERFQEQAQASSIIYSLIETAKENGLDPYRYLLWVLRNAPQLSETDEASCFPQMLRKNAMCCKIIDRHLSGHQLASRWRPFIREEV